MARASVGPLNVVIGTDIRGLESGLEKVKKKTRESANEISGMGLSLRGVGAASAWAAGAIETAGLISKAFDARYIDEFASALKDIPVIGHLARTTEDVLGTWTGINTEVRLYQRQSQIVNQQAQAHYNIVKQIREANIAGGLRVAAIEGQTNVLSPTGGLTRGEAGTREAVASQRRAMEEQFRQEEQALREQAATGPGAQAAAEARKQLEDLRRITQPGVAKDGVLANSILSALGIQPGAAALATRPVRGATFTEKTANVLNPERVKEAQLQAAAAQSVIDQNAADQEKARTDLLKRQRAEREAFAKLEANLLREQKFLENETLRPVRDAVALQEARWRVGERGTRLLAIDLEYAGKIAQAEHMRNRELADGLRYRRDQARTEERRIQGIERRQEERGISTELGTKVLGLLGRSTAARHLQVDSAIDTRLETEREKLGPGKEFERRRRQLEALRGLSHAEIGLEGGIGVGSASSQIVGQRVKLLGGGEKTLADMTSPGSSSVRVEGFDRQIALLQQIANLLGGGDTPRYSWE